MKIKYFFKALNLSFEAFSIFLITSIYNVRSVTFHVTTSDTIHVFYGYQAQGIYSTVWRIQFGLQILFSI
jgi:hypothetical protein